MDNDKPGTPKLKYAARVRLPVTGEDDLLARYGTDLHDGGMFIRHDRPPAVDALVLVEFVLGEEGLQTVSRVVGRVAHSRPATSAGEATAGMRVRFIETDEVAERVAKRAGEGQTGAAAT